MIYLMIALATLCRLITPLTAQKLYAPDIVEPGQILQGFVYPISTIGSSAREHIKFSLLNAQGKVVAKGEGFPYNYKEGFLAQEFDVQAQNWVGIGLLGIASSQEAGRYTLRVNISAQSGQEPYAQTIGQTIERLIYVQSRDFPGQKIRISPRMDSILNPTDPERIAAQRSQAQRLWSIIKRFRPEYLYFSAPLLRPVENGVGRISSPYGYVREYIYPDGKTQKRIHKGYDIAAPQGVSVLASGEGLVVMAEDRIVTGKTIMLALLPGIFLKYQHLSKILVDEGEKVVRGQFIGEIGSSGFATGSHLHLELWVASQRVDPSIYFERSLIDRAQIISMIAQN